MLLENQGGVGQPPRWITVTGSHPCETIEWRYGEQGSRGRRLQYLAYDANLCSTVLPFEDWLDPDFQHRQVLTVLEVLDSWSGGHYGGEVWLDGVCVRGA